MGIYTVLTCGFCLTSHTVVIRCRHSVHFWSHRERVQRGVGGELPESRQRLQFFSDKHSWDCLSTSYPCKYQPPPPIYTYRITLGLWSCGGRTLK